ncbi:4-hydroxybenzoate-octaprenyltransferase [Legionella lansingensis]|uniref:4-hydroxybenzoate octaprenyltransferase n=1 Tax=Legionella lansingensis TaxID=45067 RepID=A0A0W0VL33_9GAMM|nr:4-hydroxybenzoate octaprenyltransferase [Legionella lansingensis]KTD20811.1 4-hydroxybenzoate-octaprenyltransferase [Legionella lansingensis]SNV49829.1 4-hydroxybenzoate-octaprenyltransferase [Legionella lansingensis]
MLNWRAYLKLMRFHRPIGILLLWWPTAWALWLAHQGSPPLPLIVLFLLGTIFMRAAGCVVNDIADRHIDLHVQRTKNRPLTAGDVGLLEALVLLCMLLFVSLLILLQLPKVCFYYALMAVSITVLYPFCKRFLQSPQLVLGIAFSMGIPMAYAASNRMPDKTMLILLLINFLWIIAYDTEYAMVDREDDLRIGVKSTAILFAAYDKLIIAILQFLFHFCWLPLGVMLTSLSFWFCWGIAGLNLLYQQKLLSKRKPADCLRAFSSNHWYGLIMWIAITTVWPPNFVLF